MAKREQGTKSRRRKSHGRYTLYYLLAFVLVVAVGAVMSLTVFFKITSVNVVGNTMYADGEIADLTGIKTGDNLIRIPTRRIEERIVAAYPYIKDAEVRRVLPDSVTIHISMAEEAAALRKSDGRFMLVSTEGRVLKADVPVCPTGMIPVDGFTLGDVKDGENLFEKTVTKGKSVTVQEDTEEKNRFETLLSLMRAIADNNLADGIKVIDIGDMLDIKMLYEGRLAIRIGSALDMDYKLKFAALAIDSEVTDSTVGLLDVSDKPAAHLREYDIYTEEEWPFAADLRAEYERRIVKPQILPTPEPEVSESVPETETPSEAPA